MKKRLLLKMIAFAVIIFTIGKSSQAQTSEWELVFTESEEFIRDICFVPGDDGLWQTGWGITGYPESNIIKTTDGGDTWIEIEQSFSTLLASISFADEDTGYICTLQGGGTAGFILKSTDGGLTWSAIRNVTDESFDKIRFKDPQNGVVTGYPSLYTSDGGITWTESELPEEWDLYWETGYAGANTYYGVELGGDVGKTTDGGENWTKIHSFSPTMLGGIDFHDETHGLIGGDLSFVSVTHDGGASWESTTLGDGQRFGMAIGAFNEDIMYAGLDIEEIWMTTDGGETWVLDTLIEDHTYRQMVVTPYNVAYIGGTDMSDGGGTVWRRVGELPLVPMFESSENTICTGSTIDFTDLSYYHVVSWNWTFEGGTPATSTDQNPTITYDSTGVFDVSLTVTNINGDSQTITETDFIEVLETPGQADPPAGEENICTSNIYVYSTLEVEFAQSYDWELSPSDAGVLTPSDNETVLETSDSWTGDFTIRVRASNICGDGDWSDYFNGTLSMAPELFILEGGGSFCEGGEGVEITLSGSEMGVDYQLHLDGQPTGEIVEGTGDSLSFGDQTVSGIYEAIGSNDTCEVFMTDQVEVIVFDLPSPEINGLDMVCDEDVANYETAENVGSIYNWEVSGGTITDGQGTYMVTIQWGEAGNGTVTVNEEDENGCSYSTVPFEVFIDDCTGINETGNGELLSVFPNPANDHLNISFNSATNATYTIRIFNRIGQQVNMDIVHIVTGMQTHQINISQYNSGLYLIVFEEDNNVYYKSRIIKY